MRLPGLREEAETAARRLVGETGVDVVARTVEGTFLDQRFTVVADRAGRHPGRGDVHEADAARALLEANLERFRSARVAGAEGRERVGELLTYPSPGQGGSQPGDRLGRR